MSSGSGEASCELLSVLCAVYLGLSDADMDLCACCRVHSRGCTSKEVASSTTTSHLPLMSMLKTELLSTYADTEHSVDSHTI